VAVDESIGYWYPGWFLHSGGTNTVTGTLSIGAALNFNDSRGEGTYELSGTGQLATGNTFVGEAGTGTFDHLASSHTITGGLVLGSEASGIGTYNLTDGSVSEAEAVVGFSGDGTFSHDGGSHTISGPLVLGHEATGNGTYEIADGTVSMTDLVIGRDWVEDVVPPVIPDESHGTGTLVIANAVAGITVSNLLHVGQNGSIEAVPGSTIHMTGSVFENESTDPESLADMENLELVFEGGNADVDTFEVAGKSLDEAGEDANFILGELTVGGADVGHVQLVDAVDNQPDWEGEEVLYVRRLTVGAGSVLDLNGLELYCDEMTIDPTATVLGGMPVIPGQLAISVSSDYDWTYPNTPETTHGTDQHATVSVSITGGTEVPGEQYQVTFGQGAPAPAAVTDFQITQPVTWAVDQTSGDVAVAGGLVGSSTPGAYTLHVTVTGLGQGQVATATVPLVLRLYGDVDNGGAVDTADKLEINRELNGIATTATLRELDLTGDGVVDTNDKLQFNRLLNGIAVP
jgi:Dockerin type I domain